MLRMDLLFRNVVALALLIATGFNLCAEPATATSQVAKINPVAKIEAAFSPKQGATELIIKNIRAAKKSILVAAYAFTSKPIAKELIAAHKRGVNVQVVLDQSQKKDKNSVYNWLRSNSIPTRINSRYKIMHDKFMIFDENILQTGSFNYTAAAEYRNAENIIIVYNNPEIIAQYAQQWQKLWGESLD